MFNNSRHAKGSDILERVIRMLISNYNNIVIYSFGQKKRPGFISDFDLYIESATQSQIIKLYNKSSIFISTSREEGFGLTGLESMACRCALVSTKTNGIKEYANSENAILCDIDVIYNTRKVEAKQKGLVVFTLIASFQVLILLL